MKPKIGTHRRGLNTVLVLCVVFVVSVQGYADVKRYNGPSSGDDRASATAVDSNGNIYVTGRSAGNGTGYDIATVKYSPQGEQLWAIRYNGPDNADDLPNAIAVDADGNVYVTGTTRHHSVLRNDMDYVTIRYTTLFLPPDRFGRVVQGAHQDWVQTYNFADANDVAVAIAVYSGKVFVTGYSRAAAGFYDPGYDYATVAYDATLGTELWGPNGARFDNGIEDKAVALAVANGYIYVTGWAVHRGQYDIVTLRYDLNGANMVLMMRLNGWPVALTARGKSVYVAGVSGQPGANTDYLAIKYDASLNEQWQHTAEPVRGQMDYVAGLAVDSLGNVFVAGSSVGNQGELNTDMFILKWDKDGRESAFWVYDGNPQTDGPDVATAIGIDSSDNVYVTGVSVAENGPGLDYLTLKLNKGGLFYVWTKRWSSPGQAPLANDDHPTALAIDNNGNVIVTGYSPTAGQAYDFVTLKYSPAGVIFPW
jgi:uncharacterized delta-60 repeat protein